MAGIFFNLKRAGKNQNFENGGKISFLGLLEMAGTFQMEKAENLNNRKRREFQIMISKNGGKFANLKQNCGDLNFSLN